MADENSTTETAEQGSEAVETATESKPISQLSQAEWHQKMASAFGHGDEPESKAETETTEEPVTEGEPAAEEAGATEEGAEATAAVKTAPTLPEPYKRSLKALGWSDEDIASNFKALGAKFIETAAKLHESRNREVSRWAEAGRARKAQQAQQQQITGQSATQQQTQSDEVLQPLDVAALKKEFGDDKLIDKIVPQFNGMVKYLNQVLPAVQKMQKDAQQAQQSAITKTVDEFFGGKELVEYGNFYGDATKAAPTEEQFSARNKVLVLARELRDGAQLSGHDLSVSEALRHAHDIVSSGVKTQAIRQSVAKDLKKREASIGLSPSNRRTNRELTPDQRRARLEARVGAALPKIFGNR